MSEPGPASEWSTALAHGRELTVMPGPSLIPDRVREAMGRQMGDLYEGPIVELGHRVRAQLPDVARCYSGKAFLMTGNGHAAWQMATSNTLQRGSKVLVCESGVFAAAWGRSTGLSGIEVQTLPGDWRRPIDPAALAAALKADTAHEIAAVLCVHVDTATSVRNDIAALRAAIDEAEHPALFMVDCIASMGCEAFEADAWGVDVTVAACQKGLMVPPGVSFVWAGPKALAAHANVDIRVGYVDWELRLDDTSPYLYFAGTPPIAHLHGLDAAFDLVREEGGWSAVWQRHTVMASAVHAAIEAWSTPGGIEFNVLDAEHRSACVTSVLTGSIDGEQLRQRCKAQAGLTLGTGIGGMEGFRFAHMGHMNPPMILGAISTVEAMLHAMHAPMGASGAAAAAKVLAGNLQSPAGSPTLDG